MADRENILGGDDGKEMTPEERRLVALLAEMPRRSCPPRVREHVLAAVRGEARDAEEPVEPPAPREVRKARVVAIPFRRRMLRVLEAAAVLAVAVIGLKVYHDVRPNADLRPSDLVRQPAEPSNAPAVGVSLADKKESPPPESKGVSVEEKLAVGGEGGGRKDETLDKTKADLNSDIMGKTAKAAGDGVVAVSGAIEQRRGIEAGATDHKALVADESAKPETAAKSAALKRLTAPGKAGDQPAIEEFVAIPATAGKAAEMPGLSKSPAPAPAPPLAPAKPAPASAPAATPAPTTRMFGARAVTPATPAPAASAAAQAEAKPAVIAKISAASARGYGSAAQPAERVGGAKEDADVSSKAAPAVSTFDVDGSSVLAREGRQKSDATSLETVADQGGLRAGFGMSQTAGTSSKGGAEAAVADRTPALDKAAGKAPGGPTVPGAETEKQDSSQIVAAPKEGDSLTRLRQTQAGEPAGALQTSRALAEPTSQVREAIGQQATPARRRGATELVAQGPRFGQSDLSWFEVESSPAVQRQLLGRNRIAEVRAAPDEAFGRATQAADRKTTWVQFVQNSVASFQQLVGSYGGTITDSQEVVVTPGDRRALVVECDIAAANADTLVKSVSQKRMLAVSNTNADQVTARPVLTPAATTESRYRALSNTDTVFRSVSQNAAQNIGQNQLPIQRMNERDLASNRLPMVSNFYVQTLPANQADLYANRRGARTENFFNQEAEVGKAAGQTAQGFNYQVTTNAERAAGVEAAKDNRLALGQQTQAKAAPGGVLGGAFSPGGAPGGSGAPVAQQARVAPATRLYFVLEPDRLPTQVVPMASRQLPAAK